MKAIVITSKKILPAIEGGLIGTFGLIQYLSDLGYDTTFVSFYDGTDYSDDEKLCLYQYVKRIELVKMTWGNTALNVSLRFPNNIRKYTRKAMVKRLERLKEEETYELVVIDHVQLFEYAKLFPQSKIVLHTHNVEANIWKNYGKKCHGLVRYMVNRTARMTYDYERRAIAKADGVIACSDTDKDIFKEMTPNSNIAVMHTYMKFNRVKKDEDYKNSTKEIIYIGNYNWYPNQTAAEFLACQLMPELRKMVPGVKLVLVGKNETDEMKGYAAKNEDIIVTGMVDSVDDYIRHADVFVNAVTTGSGINIKMIEAIGKGIPVVTTGFGARGINVVDGESALFYDDVTGCVKCINRVFDDRVLAKSMADCARNYYENFVQPSKEVRDIFTVNEE